MSTLLSRRAVLAFPVALVAGTDPAWAQSRPQLPPASDTDTFTDPIYDYSVRVPRGWKPLTGKTRSDSPQRIALWSPNKNLLIIAVNRLPRPVRGRPEFEAIGQGPVDEIVKGYLGSFGVTAVLGEKKEDHSDDESLRFWQGTSGVRTDNVPVMVLSLHAVRIGSGVLVSIVFVSTTNSSSDVRAVDAVMRSLTLARS